MNTPQGQQPTAEQQWVRWLQCLIRKWSYVNHQFQFHTQIAYKPTYMTRDLCYLLLFVIGTDIKSNHTNSAIHSSGHSRSLLTSASDYTSAQWRLVLHILVTCSPHVNKCWVTRAIYGIHWGRSHWPITIQHVRAQRRSVVMTGVFDRKWEGCASVPKQIKTHDLLMCNIIETMSYNGCSQMVSISLKTNISFIAHPWCLLFVVGLEEYSAHDWRAATSVQRAPVTWHEWGLWFWEQPRTREIDRQTDK